MKIKKSVCRHCGKEKKTPSKTAYIYCDYCGTYMDWDFNASLEDKNSKQSGPEYGKLCTDLAPDLEHAAESEDREKYRELQRRLFDQHITSAPSSYSPRIKDPKYREAIIIYMAEAYTLLRFDSELHALEEKLNDAMAGLVWETQNFDPMEMAKIDWSALDPQEAIKKMSSMKKVTSDSLWDLYQATKVLNITASRGHRDSGLLATYPDPVEPEDLFKINASTFVDAWQPYADEAIINRILEDAGLAGEYIEVEAETVPTHSASCEYCGSAINAVEGAERVVCETCGAVSRVT